MTRENYLPLSTRKDPSPCPTAKCDPSDENATDLTVKLNAAFAIKLLLLISHNLIKRNHLLTNLPRENQIWKLKQILKFLKKNIK